MPGIGETLREARMRQRLDIADVEARTKIRAKYLRALENEEFGMLPGPDVRQDLPAHLRGDARARPARAGRGVPGQLRGRGRAGAAAARAAGGRRAATGAAGRGRARDRSRCSCSWRWWRARGDRAAGERRRRGRRAGRRRPRPPSRADDHAARSRSRRRRRRAWRSGSCPPRRPTCAWTAARHAGGLREHDRRPADLPRQARAREPRASATCSSGRTASACR